MKHKFLLLYSWLVRSSLFFFPDIPLIMRFRGFLYGLGMLECGRDFQVPHSVIINTLEKLSVGNNVCLGSNVVIIMRENIVIEDEVLIGPNVVIVSGNHQRIGHSFRYGKGEGGKIIISRGAWIGANCTIIMNSRLPSGSVLAANSLLNKGFDNHDAIYGGTPARLVKNL